uniref:(northern house mosquito) hypothetical protein n=1 Tax=Culex pipiens TaxID=7175 RepID=A0A8D8FL74_CULPI
MGVFCIIFSDVDAALPLPVVVVLPVLLLVLLTMGTGVDALMSRLDDEMAVPESAYCCMEYCGWLEDDIVGVSCCTRPLLTEMVEFGILVTSCMLRGTVTFCCCSWDDRICVCWACCVLCCCWPMWLKDLTFVIGTLISLLVLIFPLDVSTLKFFPLAST